MAMFVVYTDGRRENTVYVGQKIHIPDTEINDVAFVQIDGTELQHVISTFKNLPLASPISKHSVTWFGDHAKFIVANW